MLKEILAGLAIVGVAAVGAVSWGHRSLDTQVQAEVDDLTRNVGGVPTEKFNYDMLAGLPEPVQRFFRASVSEGTPIAKYVHLKQTGEFRPDPKGEWKPFQADQWYSVNPPRFVWKASMDFAPLVSVIGRDQYYRGQSKMTMKVLGLVPVVDASGPELEISALIRYVSEMQWFPTSMLPSEHVQWSPIDANSARITFRDGDLSTTAVYTFDDAGVPTGFLSNERYYGAGSDSSIHPWWGRSSGSGFKEVAPSVKIATEGSAGWDLPEGEFEYIKVRITEIEYR